MIALIVFVLVLFTALAGVGVASMVSDDVAYDPGR
jgi:hypothetical protein